MRYTFFAERIWCESSLRVFLERFLLAVLAGAVITLVMLNALKLDWHQRIALLVILLAAAYLIGYTVQKTKPPATPATDTTSPMNAEHPAAPSGPASTQGDQSPAVTGNDNFITYGPTPPRKQKKPGDGKRKDGP